MIKQLAPFDASNYRCKLYGVTFNYVTNLSLENRLDLSSELHKWCTEMYGPGYTNYSDHPDYPITSRWVNDLVYGFIKFRDEIDYMHFMLVWG